MHVSILYVEDSMEDFLLLERLLKKEGISASILRLETEEDLRSELFSERHFDIVLSDFYLPGFTGMDVLEIVGSRGTELPVIIVSGRVGEEKAVEIIRAGAKDYIMKENLRRLVTVIERELKDSELKREKKKVQEQLRITEERFSSFFNSSRDPMIVSSPRSFTLLDISNSFAENLGIEKNSILGRPLSELPFWKDSTLVEETIKEIFRGGEMRNRELSTLTTDGRERTVIWSVELMETEGRKEYFWMGRDVTEKIEIDKNLRRSEKLRSLGTLAGGIAHDFNNILMIIMGYAELAQGKTGNNSQLDRYLEEVNKAVDRAQDLIQQILTFSRQTEGEPQFVSISSIAKEVLKLLRPSLPSTIAIRHTISSESTVHVDPIHIHQILMNLCTNAFHSMKDEGGILTVEVSDKNGWVDMIVEDTGCGMDNATIDRMFEPFFSTKSINEGTGLGLSVVHGIVEQYEGTIYVDSEENRGTRITISLPKREEKETILSHAVEMDGSKEKRSGTILIVDDEPEVLEVISIMLKDLGYVVRAFTSPVEALKEYENSPSKYEYLVTDYTMPEMTGLELVRRITDLTTNLPVIVCSGYKDIPEINNILDVGGLRVLGKPLRKKQLAAALTELMQQTGLVRKEPISKCIDA